MLCPAAETLLLRQLAGVAHSSTQYHEAKVALNQRYTQQWEALQLQLLTIIQGYDIELELLESRQIHYCFSW
jgi:hypothetical protein